MYHHSEQCSDITLNTEHENELHRLFCNQVPDVMQSTH